MSYNRFSEYRKKKHQNEKKYINSLVGNRSIPLSSFSKRIPYVHLEQDIYFCNRKVDKSAIIEFRKKYDKLQKMNDSRDYRDYSGYSEHPNKYNEHTNKCSEINDKEQTLLFINKPNIQVYLGYSKNNGVYFNLKSAALQDDIVLIDPIEYKDIKKAVSLSKNVFNNTVSLNKIDINLTKVTDLIHVTLGGDKIYID